MLLLAGLLGIATGIVIVIGWPWTGLWAPGLFLAIDLLVHATWWLMIGFAPRQTARQP